MWVMEHWHRQLRGCDVSSLEIFRRCLDVGLLWVALLEPSLGPASLSLFSTIRILKKAGKHPYNFGANQLVEVSDKSCYMDKWKTRQRVIDKFVTAQKVQNCQLEQTVHSTELGKAHFGNWHAKSCDILFSVHLHRIDSCGSLQVQISSLYCTYLYVGYLRDISLEMMHMK